MANKVVLKDYRDFTTGVSIDGGVKIVLFDQGGGLYSESAAGGGGGGGGAVTVADGADVTQGAVADAVVAAGAAGSISAKLRRLSADIGTWIATIGTKNSAGSASVTLASDDAQIGAKTTASVIGAGGSGIIGWLSAISGLLPLSLGQKTMATALAVSIASDQTSLGTVPNTQAGVTDVAGANWAAASGASSGIIDSTGPDVAFNVSLTTYNPGASAVGLDAFLEESLDGGTTWDLVWCCERMTVASSVRVPAQLFRTRSRRWRWQNTTATNTTAAATSAAATINANKLSIPPTRTTRQYFDRTQALLVNPASAATTSGVINSVATAGAGYDTGGATNIAAVINVGAAATPATYQLQVCPFNSTSSADWVGVGTATLAVANSSVRLSAAGITERFFRVVTTVAGAAQAGNYVCLTASS